MKTRNTMQPCAGCHSAIDPIGVGFAQFDATGRFDPSLDDAGVYGIAPALPDAPESGFASIIQRFGLDVGATAIPPARP